jgi:hypothetical protein
VVLTPHIAGGSRLNILGDIEVARYRRSGGGGPR